jgi:hypothetical protein
VTAQPALVSHHCTEAGLIEKAVEYWLKAGQLSVRRSAMAEAVTQLQRGLEVLRGLPEGVGRKQQEFDLRVALGPAPRKDGRLPTLMKTIIGQAH